MNLYFFCPENSQPSGGVKQIYRQVDILNNNGFSAFVVHQNENFRCNWFANSTLIAYTSQIEIKTDDYLIVPEILVKNIANIQPKTKKIIFNQNAYYTFYQFNKHLTDFNCPYYHRDLLGVMVVSEDNKNYLNYVFPDLNIWQITYGINTNLFNHNCQKKKQIAFMSRKNYQDVLQVINLFKFRNIYHNYNFVDIDSKSEAQVSQIFKESLIFLSFGYPEGFGLPPIEAMACECIVIGYHGNGGQEYFRPEFSYPIQCGDIIGFTKTLESVIQEFETNPEFILAKAKKGREYILSKYSPAQEEESIVSTWNQIISQDFNYLSHATIIHDFAEFSGKPVIEIEHNMNHHNQLVNQEWENIEEKSYADKALKFYEKSKYYIYDLLSFNYNHLSVINKLNCFNPLIFELMKKHSGKDFLEFGGGIGVVCEIAYKLGKNVTYLDIPGQVFDFATWRFKKYNLPINIICSHPNHLSLNQKYDLIFSDAVIEHVINPQATINTLCQYVKNNGLLILLLDLSGHNEEYPMHQDIDIVPIHQIIENNCFVNISGKNSFCSIWRKIKSF